MHLRGFMVIKYHKVIKNIYKINFYEQESFFTINA